MLEERGHRRLDIDEYRQIYEHPIQRIYEKTGFDLAREPFKQISDRWHRDYVQRFTEVALRRGALSALEHFKRAGIIQAVLSALPHDILEQSISRFGLHDYFLHIQGLEDNLGRSKIDNGRKMIGQFTIAPQSAILIGDTGHDFETAQALGLRCVLVAGGAEDKERLLSYGCPVIDDFAELLTLAQESYFKYPIIDSSCRR